MVTVPTVATGYTLEEAEADIAELRGLVDALTEALPLLDGPVVNVPAASGGTLYSASGDLKYVSFDGIAYNIGRSSIVITANQTINSASDTVIGANSVPMSWTVGIGTYLIDGMVNWSQNATTSTAQNFGLSGPAISSWRFSSNHVGATGTGETVNMRELFGASLGDGQSPGFPAATVAEWHFRGVLTTTAAGTLSVVANAPTPANTFVLGANSWASLYPVS